MTINLTQLSRTISHALRHKPWLYELELDEAGWTSVEDLLASLRRDRTEWQNLTKGDLVEMVSQADKQRYELQNDKIRALYGHSLPGKLAKVAAKPPEILYHGTSPEAATIIQREGIKPMSRQYIHLSVDLPTAKEVGRRKSKHAIILQVLAEEADQNGVAFYQGNEMTWLADFIPPEYIAVSHDLEG